MNFALADIKLPTAMFKCRSYAYNLLERKNLQFKKSM